MSRDDALARRLAHDVGKYVARVARNLAPGRAPSGELLDMLCRDLYLLDGRRASERLADLVASSALALDGRVQSAAALLAEVDALEPGVRSGEPSAVSRAAAAAVAVERLLREVARR